MIRTIRNALLLVAITFFAMSATFIFWAMIAPPK